MTRTLLTALVLSLASLCYAAEPPTPSVPATSPAAARPQPIPEEWDYVAPMKKIAARFKGVEGVVIHVGASMTIASPYGDWARNGRGKTPEDVAVLKWMHCRTNDKTDGWWLCKTELVSHRAYTSESGLESTTLLAGGKAGLPPLERLLADYKPRMVTIEVGIYDVENKRAVEEYQKNMSRALDMILDAGAIPILTTIPPFKADMELTRTYNKALRAMAKERGIPVLDIEREILLRRPSDWFGTLTDRIHLTARQAGGSTTAEPTAENLSKSGYLLRGWLTVQKIAEVKKRVLDSSEKRE